MKLFISWSGERSKALAQSLHDWIPLVLHYVEPWLSEADIEAGDRWAEAVAKQLESSNFGIVCITKENVASPWVLFESGALAKSLQGSKVIPLLLDLEFRDITGPLAQFQAKKADKAGIGEVVHSINQGETQTVPEARAKQLFEALWPDFERQIQAIPKSATVVKHTRPQTEILEELVSSVRSLDSKFREVSDEPSRSIRNRKMWFHPKMLFEMSHMMGSEPGDPVSILILASFFRDEMPWLYELGMEAYRAYNAGFSDQGENALCKFQQGLKMMMNGPFPFEKMFFDPKMFDYIVRELEHLPIRYVKKDDEKQNKPHRKKSLKDEQN